MTEQVTGYLCVSLVCCGWPLLFGYVGFNLGRHGGRGWWRLIVLRLKAWGGSDGSGQ